MSPQTSNNRFSEFLSYVFTESGTPPRAIWQGIQAVLVFASCFSMLLENYEPYRIGFADFISTLELIAVGFLTVDYLGTLYFSEDRMRYVFSFWGLVDLLSVLPFYLLLLNPTSGVLVKSLRGLRFLRVLLLWKMTRGRL
jgi:voltage-gated potassium channel